MNRCREKTGKQGAGGPIPTLNAACNVDISAQELSNNISHHLVKNQKK